MSHTQEPSSSSSQNERINFPQDGDGEVAHGSVVSESNSNIEKGPGKGLNNMSTNKS